jgi:hypothetical protein
MFAVMKTFVTVISASTGRNDFIFNIWLWHGDLYRVSPFQVYKMDENNAKHLLYLFIFSFSLKQDVARYVMLRIPPLVHL